MVEIKQGDIFQYRNKGYIINPINDQGIMGKGLALQFKKTIPSHFEFVRSMGYNNKISVGQMVFDEKNMVIGFPTKMSWRGKSHLKFIEEGLESLLIDMKEKNIDVVYAPALGCGLGELLWQDVKALINKIFHKEKQKLVVVLNEGV